MNKTIHAYLSEENNEPILIDKATNKPIQLPENYYIASYSVECDNIEIEDVKISYCEPYIQL